MHEGQKCSHLSFYRFEQVRLASFELWNGDKSIVSLLAKSGFFSIPEGDLVQCFTCDMKFNPTNKENLYTTLRDHAKICTQLFNEPLPSFTQELASKLKSDSTIFTDYSTNTCCYNCLELIVKSTICVLRNLTNNINPS